jgi:uncharacterized protein (DUF2147 family)
MIHLMLHRLVYPNRKRLLAMIPERGLREALVMRLSGRNRRWNSVLLRSLHQLGHAALLVAAIIFLAVPRTMVWAAVPQGVWLIDAKVAVQIFECQGLLCGRILWLKIPRDPQGQLDRDKKNPDPAVRQRRLCGLTILWGLHPAGPDRWEGGWFYNPDDGKTYRASAQLRSADVHLFGDPVGRRN